MTYEYGPVEIPDPDVPVELPSAGWLAAINAVHPGFAEAYWEEYVEESRHRREYVQRAGAAGIRHRMISLIGAWIFGAIALGVSAYLIDRNHSWPGALIGVSHSITTAVSLLATRAHRPEAAVDDELDVSQDTEQ